MKSFNQMQVDFIRKYYKEHRGVLIEKYRSLSGKYVFVIEENKSKSKVYVGKSIFENTQIGSQLTIGEIKRKLINICPGICK